MPENPPLEPHLTVEHVSSPDAPSTVDDAGAYQPAGATGPYVFAPPADVPSIPGYRITAEIARGGMGRVYAGHDLTLDREVAIKTVLRGADAERFVVEAKITAKLPHPGIPPVHALGALEDGSPYLAMKLIRGRTLADMLKERPSPLHELPRFVQIFEQIAQAVGFAHAQGIVHRDLKPLNVMVGAFGEVQVMDWGLAKDLASRERPEGQTEDDNDTHTVAGTILGTPGYMAPEQARGEFVDARADVFALGATLAAILTGRPAFVGTTVRDTLDRTARADLADVLARLESSGADAELAALARRCLSAQAQQRPADGREVGAEVAAYRAGVEARLRQAQTERAEALVREAEQRKRRRTVQVAGGLVAVVLVAGLGVSLWQMNVASAERDAKARALEAESKALADETKARDQAFEALRSMTDEVFERKFAQGAVLTEDDRAFLRDIIAQFDAFATIKGDDADSRYVRAEGRFRVGKLRFTLGERKEAEKDYDQAVSLQKQLVADFPSRPEFRRTLAASYNNRGILLLSTGRLKEAEADSAAALSLQQQLAADFPALPESRRSLAGSHNNRARLLHATGRFEEAEKEIDEALRLQKQLVSDFPAQPGYRRELAGSLNNRGVMLRSTRRLKEAEKDHDEALSIRKQLAAGFPSRPEFRQDLAASHDSRGKLLFSTGRLKEAEKDYDEALSISKQLAADFPSRPEFRQDLAASHIRRGELLFSTGRGKEAEKDLDEALSIRKQLAADFPNQFEYRQELAWCHYNRGGLLQATGRLKEAEAEYTEALNLCKQLAADFPTRPDLQNDLAGTYGDLASLHLQQGAWTAAKRLLLESRPHHLDALKANPRHADFRQYYHKHLNALTLVHAGLLEKTDAVRTAETRHDLGWDPPEDAYYAACFLSLCIPIMAKHDKLDEQQRKSAVQFYGDAAMKLLRDAASKDYKDVARMRNDAALIPLRPRDDFMELVAELERKGK